MGEGVVGNGCCGGPAIFPSQLGGCLKLEAGFPPADTP